MKFEVDLDSKGFDSSLKRLESNTKASSLVFAGVMADVANSVKNTVTKLVTYPLEVGSSFESAMSRVGATSEASAVDMQKLSDKAKEMGAITKFSATESAKALNYMAMAGWKTQAMLDGLSGIMDLAAASGESLGSVADIVTDALTAFGLSSDKSGHFADVLATASSNANTNVALMGATFKYVAPVAGALGYSVEDTAVAIGLMANAGIKGEMAGTQLRSMLNNLASPTKEMSLAMADLGISIKNNDGSMKTFDEILQNMRQSFNGLDEQQRASYASTIAGKQAMSGLLAIVSASGEDFDKLSSAINHAEGSASKMAKTANDNLKGDLTILSSTAESCGIAIYEKLQNPLRNMAQYGTKALSDLLANGKSVANIFKTGLGISATVLATKKALDIAKITTVTVKSAVVAINAFNIAQKTSAGATAFATTFLTSQQLAIGFLTGKLSLNTVATALATKAQLAFNAAFISSPIGLAVVAISAFSAGLLYLYHNLHQKQKEANKAFEEMIAPIKETTQAYRDMKKASDEQLSSQLGETAYVRELGTELERLVDANGNIVGSKERAKFIIDEINKIMPDSIKYVNDEKTAILNNTEAIREQVRLKEANLLLETLESEAHTARLERMNSLKQVAELDSQVTKKELEFSSLRAQARYDEADLLRQNIDELKATRKEALINYENYAKDIDNYENLAIAIQAGNNEEITRIMNERNLGYKKASDSTIEELTNKRKELILIQSSLNEQIKTNSSESTKALLEDINKQIDETDREIEARTPEDIRRMKETGANLTKGLALGIMDPQAVNAVIVNSKSVANTAVNTVKQTTQQRSPSKVMKGIGAYFTEGFAIGISSKASLVLEAAEEMSKKAIENARAQAKSYKEIGTMYVSSMKDGINTHFDIIYDQVETLVDKQVEIFAKKNKKAGISYEKSAKELMNLYKEALKAGAQEANRVINERISQITETAQKQYDEIVKKQEKLQEKLSGFGSLFSRDEDGKIQLENIKNQTKALEEYQDILVKLKEKGISGDLLKEIMSLGIEDGTDLGKKLLSKPKELEKYNEAWMQKQEIAKSIAEQFYAEELQTLDENFTQELDVALADIPNQCTEVGMNAIQGIIDGMDSKRDEATSTAKSIADAIIAEFQRVNEIHSPSRRMAREVGRPLTQGLMKGMQEAYDPSVISGLAERMLIDVNASQAEIASGLTSMQSFNNTSNNSSISNDLTIKVDKVINDGKGSIETFLTEAEFYRRRRSVATG